MKKTLFFATIIFMLAGCNTYETKMVDKFKARGEIHEDAYVDYYSSFRSYLSEEVEIDGKKVFVPKYGILKLADIESKLVSSIAIVNGLTDYGNQENAAFIDEFKLRDELEHDKKILEAKLQRVKLARLHETFRSLTGLSFHGMASENGKYDIQRVFWPTDLESAFPFTFDKIDDAKQRGVLKEIEREAWSSNRMFDRKDLDPAKLDDPNAFVWKSKEESLEVVSYKILDSDKPENNQSDYIEGFRIVNDKQEGKPALKIFFPQGNSNGVMVLDADKEGELGFGIPDFVQMVFISRITDIWNSASIVPDLFTDKEVRVVSQKPESKPIAVEIARIGAPVETWETTTDRNGWTVPFNFKNDIGDNYNVRLKLEDVSSEMILNRRIEYVVKEWIGGNRFTSSIGAVVEYFKPKPFYGNENIAQALIRASENTKMIALIFEDGTIEIGIVAHASNKYIEDEPYAVEYTEGQKRWRLEKSFGATIFNKRKEVAVPTKQATGVY